MSQQTLQTTWNSNTSCSARPLRLALQQGGGETVGQAGRWRAGAGPPRASPAAILKVRGEVRRSDQREARLLSKWRHAAGRRGARGVYL